MNSMLTIKKFMAKSLTIMFTLVTLLSLVTPAVAQQNSVTARKKVPIASSQEQGPTDPAELEAFLDELLGKEMEENHIAGAAVSVVKDGELILAKGYGYADLAKGIRVDPEQTLFGVGSVGKTFTWTAVMQPKIGPVQIIIIFLRFTYLRLMRVLSTSTRNLGLARM